MMITQRSEEALDDGKIHTGKASVEECTALRCPSMGPQDLGAHTGEAVGPVCYFPPAMHFLGVNRVCTATVGQSYASIQHIGS